MKNVLEFILGRAGSGKTKYVRKLLSEKLNNGENNIILLVPEQFSFESEKMLLESVGAKNMMGIEVLSFTRLANSVIDNTPYSSLPRIDDGGRAVLLRLALDSLGENLKIYRKFKSNYNGLSSLLTFIQEMKQCAVTPEELKEKTAFTSGILSEKLKELSLIFEAYDSFMSKDYFDDYNLLSVANEEMLTDNFFAGKTVVLDAFTGYTAQELKIVDTILKQSQEVYMTLCTDSFDGYGKYSPFSFINDTAKRIVSLCEKNKVEYKKTVLENSDKSRFTSDLEHLEKNLYATKPEKYDGDENNIKIIRCDSRLEECRAVSKEIKRLMREENVRCRDIAVFERTAGTYDKTFGFMFKKYGIPFFEDNRMPVSSNPLVMAVRYALRIASRGIDTDRILSILKTEMTCVSADDISLLETYCFVWSIKGSEWKNEWTKNPAGFSSEISEEDENTLALANELRQKVIRWINSFVFAFKNGNGKQKSEAVYKFLIDIGADKKLFELASFIEKKGESAVALEQERVWNSVMQILDTLANITGENEISPKQYSELFEIFISGLTLGSVPQGLDNVALADAQRSRLSSPEYLFVLGLNEGEFPKDSPNNGILTESERRVLLENGLEILPACDGRFTEERYIVYHALTSASKRLYLLYNSGSTESGTDSPSEVIENVLSIFPSVSVSLNNNENSLSEIESEQGAFTCLASSWNEKSDFSLMLLDYFSSRGEYKGIIDSMKRVSDGNKKETRINNIETATRLFKRDMYLSASKVEDFYKCPFRYFCRYGLKVNPLKKAQIDYAFSGIIIHRCLEKLIEAHGRQLGELPLSQRRKEIREILDEYAEKEMDSNRGQSAKFIYNYNYHVDIVSRLVDRLITEFEFSDFVPKGFELSIGPGKTVSPYEITASDGSIIRITGNIDRVDVFEKDGKSYVRIVDYKSGTKDFCFEDVPMGLNCQMFIYLFALWKNGGEKFPDFVPSGMLYFKASDKFVTVDFSMSEENKKSKLAGKNKMAGVVLDDDDIILAMDKSDSGNIIPATTSNKDYAIDLEEFERYREIVEGAISEMAVMLHNGEVSIYPAKTDDYSDICSRCDYRAVCGINENDECREKPYGEVEEDAV